MQPVVDCMDAVNKTRGVRSNDHFPKVNLTKILPHHVIALGGKCLQMRDTFGFRRYPQVSQEELDYPLAFSILFYKDLQQVGRRITLI